MSALDLMKLASNPIKAAKAEILKLDENHNGKPDALEAIEALEKTCDQLADFVSHFDAQDVRELLNLLPSRVKSKIPPTLVDELAAELPLLPVQLAATHAALANLEGKLKS